MNLQQSILNMIIVSIPEELFITALILILLGVNKYISTDKEDLKENLPKLILIGVIPSAFASNLLRFIFPNIISENVLPLICIVIEAIGIFVLCNKKGLKEIAKIIGATIGVFVLFMISEMISVIVVVFLLKHNMSYFNQSAIQNFIIAIPERLVQYGVLTFLIIKKNSILQINITKQILSNSLLKYMTITFTIGNLITLLFLAKFVIWGHFYDALPQMNKLIAIVLHLIPIILNLFMVYMYALCIYRKEKLIQQSLIKEVKEYYEENNSFNGYNGCNTNN